jgi:NAD(P)-dependent dehydrogenase (short-subunit alcohol dehydrogenase family)
LHRRKAKIGAFQPSKDGVIAFTKDLACKWGAHHIQANAIAPGWFPASMSEVVIERNKEYFLKGIPLSWFDGSETLKEARRRFIFGRFGFHNAACTGGRRTNSLRTGHDAR